MASPIGLEPLQNYLVPASGTTHGYRFTQTMEAARVYEISFRDFQLNGRAFAPSGVLIDNTRADGDVSIIINEVAYRIVCKKGEFLHLPYPAPLQQTVSLQGEGLTTVIFVDYPVLPFTSATGTGGGGGGTGGRSTMFHGFQGTILKAGAVNGTYNNMTVAAAALDPDGWNVSGVITVPSGVDKIRAGFGSLVMGASGRESCAWSVDTFPVNTITAASAGLQDTAFVDFGIFDVTAGQQLIFQGNPAADATIGGVLVIEVLQGAILNT